VLRRKLKFKLTLNRRSLRHVRSVLKNNIIKRDALLLHIESGRECKNRPFFVLLERRDTCVS